MILETLAVGPFMSNCYLVGCEQTRKGMIVDAGAEAGKIIRTAQKLKLDIQILTVTHTHVDHVAAVKQVIDATGAKLALHAKETGEDALHSLGRMLGPMIGGSADKLPAPDLLLKDGDILEIGTLRFEVLHTPGHSPGGISLYGEGVVFSGDTLFNFGIGRTDFPGCNYSAIMDSLHNKLLKLPDDTRVYPGHGPSTTIGAERQWNPFLIMGS